MRPLLLAAAMTLGLAGLSGCSSNCQQLGDRLCACRASNVSLASCQQVVTMNVQHSNSADENACSAALKTCSAPAQMNFCAFLEGSDGKAACGLTLPQAPSEINPPQTGDGTVTLSWPLIPYATSYNVYYSNSEGPVPGQDPETASWVGCAPSTCTQLANFPNGGSVTDLPGGATYWFVVTSVDGMGESTASYPAVSATLALPVPAAPTGVTATAGTGQVTLTFSASTYATSYNAYYSQGQNVTTSTELVNFSSGEAVTGLTSGDTYSFIVTAVDATGESPPSTVVSAQVP